MTTKIQLTTRQHTTPSADEFGIILQQSQMLVKTGFLPNSIKTPEQALAIILTGRELGIPSMAALNTINVIQGKPTVSPQLMLALIERSGQLEDIKYSLTPDSVSVTMKRKGRTAHTETFGWAEAEAMQLSGKDNYRKQAAVMFKWRAVAACARVVFPDVILGLYTPDEMGATVNADGEVVAMPEMEKVSTPAPILENAAEAQETQRRKDVLAEIAQLMHGLNDAGDSIRWDKQVIADFIAEIFGEVRPVKDLDYAELVAIANELEMRLQLLTRNTCLVAQSTEGALPEEPVKPTAGKTSTKANAATIDAEVF